MFQSSLAFASQCNTPELITIVPVESFNPHSPSQASATSVSIRVRGEVDVSILTRGMQVTHLWKSGISPILNRAGLAEKQEQVTSQLKFGVSCDQNWSK